MASTDPARFLLRVVVKALVLFALVNLAFPLGKPAAALGRISAYNILFPGRERLPYGDNPARAYNLSLFQLEAMFASHKLAGGPKPADEFRVIVIGDSSVWGFLLENEHTLSAYLNRAGITLPSGRIVRAYNLGYPVMSVTKDLLILEQALKYQPDLIVWPLTLESLPYDKQLFPPLLQHNAPAVRRLIAAYDLKLDGQSPDLIQPSFWEKTLIGQRRELADVIRLQLYGVMWAATGIDQDIPEEYTLRQENLPADDSFHDFRPPQLPAGDLAYDVLRAGTQMAGKTPILFVNEPVFISRGENSHIRYNFYYPRWAYDEYREQLAQLSRQHGWHYIDLWDAVPPEEFTNTAVHLSPQGEALLASRVGEAILEILSE